MGEQKISKRGLLLGDHRMYVENSYEILKGGRYKGGRKIKTS